MSYKIGDKFIGNSERKPICTIEAISNLFIDYYYSGFIVDKVEAMVSIKEFEDHIQSGLWQLLT